MKPVNFKKFGQTIVEFLLIFALVAIPFIYILTRTNTVQLIKRYFRSSVPAVQNMAANGQVDMPSMGD
jgi:hypothetical protein